MTITDDTDIISTYNPTAYKSESSRSTSTDRVNLSVNPSEDDLLLCNQIRQLFYDAKSHRKNIVQRWNKSHKMVRGRMWGTSTQGGLQNPSTNEIFPIVRSIVGWMTDRRFHTTVSVASAPFTAFTDFYQHLAMDLETVMDSTWHVNREEAEVTMMLWDAMIYGTGILKTCWINTLAGGMGDAKITRLDPYGFYPDPSAKSMDQANYFIEVKNMSVQELDRRFPGAASKFQAGQDLESIDEPPSDSYSGTVPRANPAAISPSTSARYGRPGGPSQLQNGNYLLDAQVTVFEAWVREHETYKTTISDPEEGDHVETHVFDTWRVIVIAGNHVLLNERADDIWQHGSHPYSRYVAYDLGEFWGIGLVELLASSQETINRLLAAAVQNIELLGNPILLEDNNSGTSRTQVTNVPGKRLTKNKNTEVKWMEPPKIQSDIPNFLAYFLQRMETISGLSAINRGATPTGRNAEGVIDSVQESAFVGIRMALRSLEYTLRDAGTKKASLIVEYYTVDRQCAIVGQSGTRTTLSLRARHFMLPSSTGNTPMEYSLLIDAGANTDTSRKVREDKAQTLFALGALDPYSLLEALEWPNRDKVMERLQQFQQAGMMQEVGKRERARA